MSRGWLLVWVWIIAMLQAYFISGATAGLYSINLVLLTVLPVVLGRSARLSMITATWGGLWLDVAAGQLGPRILAFVLITIVIWWAKNSLGIEFSRRSVVAIAALLLAYLYQALVLLLSWLSVRSIYWRWEVVGWWTLEAVITAGLAWIFSIWLNNRFGQLGREVFA